MTATTKKVSPELSKCLELTVYRFPERIVSLDTDLPHRKFNCEWQNTRSGKRGRTQLQQLRINSLRWASNALTSKCWKDVCSVMQAVQ